MLYIRLIYLVPSIVLYIVVVVLLYRTKQRLSGSFYSLLLLQAITNIVVFTNSFYYVQLANETKDSSWWHKIYTNAPEALVRITRCLATHLAFSQVFMTFFISLNRMTLIVWPKMRDEIWKKAVPVCAALACFSPFIATYPFLTRRARWGYSRVCQCYIVLSETDTAHIMRQLFIFLCVFLALSSAVNIVSVSFLYKRTKHSSAHLERKMLILALLSFLIECTFFILYTHIYTSDYASVSSKLIPYASDLMTLHIPYLLILLNKSIRGQLLKSTRCCKALVSERDAIINACLNSISLRAGILGSIPVWSQFIVLNLPYSKTYTSSTSDPPWVRFLLSLPYLDEINELHAYPS